MKTKEEIFFAFSKRIKPGCVLASSNYDSLSEIYQDAVFFEGKSNTDICCADLEKYPDCIFGFSSGAFLYYLPGIIASSVSNNFPHLLVIHSIVTMLDRGNAPNTWDLFFSDRWSILTEEECDVMLDWLLWLSEFRDLSFGENSISRAFDTIIMISNKAVAYPIASFKG